VVKGIWVSKDSNNFDAALCKIAKDIDHQFKYPSKPPEFKNVDIQGSLQPLWRIVGSFKLKKCTKHNNAAWQRFVKQTKQREGANSEIGKRIITEERIHALTTCTECTPIAAYYTPIGIYRVQPTSATIVGAKLLDSQKLKSFLMNSAMNYHNTNCNIPLQETKITKELTQFKTQLPFHKRKFDIDEPNEMVEAIGENEGIRN